MNFKKVTLTAPNGQFVELGGYNAVSRSGFTLEDSSIQVAPRIVFSDNLPLVPGGIVAPGRIAGRIVELSGTIVGNDDLETYNLARELVTVTRDTGFTPVNIAYEAGGVDLELEGFLSGSVEISPADGSPWLTYSLTLECADPIAKAEQQEEMIPGDVVTGGTSEVFPSILLTLTGEVTSVRVGSTTVGEFVQLDGLSATAEEVFIETRPGFETVEVDSVAALNLLNLASSFFPLAPGINAIQVEVLAGTGSAAGVMVWKDGFLL
jgi:hypothetical protein